MLIVIEGPDRVGKSTLVGECRRMISDAGRQVVSMHRGSPDPDSHPLHDYALPISVYTPASPGDRGTCSIICDRLHLGDLTYGPIYRGECRQTAEMVHYTTALIDARGGVKVHMTSDPEIVIRRVKAEGEINSYLKIPDVHRVVDAYRQVCGPDWLDVNTASWRSLGDTRGAARILVQWAREREAKVRPVYEIDSDYVGPLRPRALFVGQERDDAPAPPRYAAYTPWENSAGEFLIGGIIDAGYSLSADVGVTSLSPSSDIASLHAVLGSPKVIALGEAAAAHLRVAGITVKTILADPEVEKCTAPRYREIFVASIRESVPPDNRARMLARATDASGPSLPPSKL